MGKTDRTGLRPSTSTAPAGPIRTCIGCRVTDSRSALLRIVAGEGHDGHPAAVPDPAARTPGRGCWLHPDPECLALAVRRRAFPRALRMSAPLEVTLVAAYLEACAPEANLTEPDRKRVNRDEPPMSTQK
ncbi:YlxR family protein [Nostocoides australiense]|nr:YlxR family protein [Actinomycetota bacterium]HPF79313.1 YlxR family protein [Tetrasphaera australiensis]HRW02694.1 YlxR family protein [Tetrasphaera sp.]